MKWMDTGNRVLTIKHGGFRIHPNLGIAFRRITRTPCANVHVHHSNKNINNNNNNNLIITIIITLMILSLLSETYHYNSLHISHQSSIVFNSIMPLEA